MDAVRSDLGKGGEESPQPEVLLGKGSHGGNSLWVSMESEQHQELRGSVHSQHEQRLAEQAMVQQREEAESKIPGLDKAVQEVAAEKSKGNDAFQAGNQVKAVLHYNKAIDLLLKPPLAATATANKTAVTLRCNLAASYLKQGQHKLVIQECTKALLMDKMCVKALFRRAEAYRELGMYSKAVADLDRARSLEPRNQMIHFAYEDAEELLEEEGDQAEDRTSVPDNKGAAKCQLKDGGLPPDDVFNEVAENFANQCMDMCRTEYAEKSDVTSLVAMYHGDLTNKELPKNGGMGKIVIDGAFQSSDMLRSALEYVRSQHTTLDASIACVCVRKSTMLYPLVWWAGTWPFDINQDGVFVELSSAATKHMGTWFMPLSANGNTLLPAQKLDSDCSMLVDMPSVFPLA